MTRTGRLALMFLVIAGLPISAAHSQAPKRDAKVQAAISQMTAAYKALTAVHIKMAVRAEVSDPGMVNMADVPESVEIRFQKPNKLVLDSWRNNHGKRVHSLLVCDGANFWKWDSASREVSRNKAPASLSDLKDLPSDSPEMDILLRNKEPFQDFNVGGPEVTLTMGGPAKLGDAMTDVIEARMPAVGSPISGVLRIRLGQADHLVRGISFDGGGADPKTKKELKFKFEVTYPILNPAPVFTPADFLFAMPPGARLKAAPAPTGSGTISPGKKTSAKT